MDQTEKILTLEGEVEDVIYQNDENGYTVCVIAVEDEPVTVVGIMPGILVGDVIRVMGNWTSHPTYGKQFKATCLEKNLPVDEKSMLRYLSSRAVKGVGPKLAQRIVDRFGEAAFDVLENNPDLLADVHGISVKKAREISAAFKEQFGVRKIMMYFGSYFGSSTTMRIYKKWGVRAVEVAEKDPYILCDEIFGVGFERADAMAQAMGFEKDSPGRLRAGLRYVLRFNASANGHCYLPKHKLVAASAALMEVEPQLVEERLNGLCLEGDLIRAQGEDCPVYLPPYFRAEISCATKLCELNRINLYGSVEDAERLIEETELREGITYAPAQREAIRTALSHSVTLITGGPGTGKTTIVKAIVSLFERVGMKIALAAPTGRAAKRLGESTGSSTRTIHRLLEIEYTRDDTTHFIRNEKNPLEEDVIIVDESSMMDVLLFASLLCAIRPGARLILIGDSDQLPSVGAGEVLRDTIRSDVFPVCRLERIYRQSGDSDIVENAHRVNRGEYPVSADRDGDFFLMARPSLAASVETVVSLCRDRLPRKYGQEASEGIQVLSCTRKGDLGTVRLNALLQDALNPPAPDKREKAVRDLIFREGDKVMQIRNDYDLEWESTENEGIRGNGVFNGDIGRILSVDHAEETVTVLYDDHKVSYMFEELDEIEHAFAVTVHKSQGSEYPIVILPLFNPPPMLATRNLLYTGITRAKKLAILVGDPASFHRMVDNDRVAERYTGLCRAYQLLTEGGT
ncbi:MAG: ATP-dependent RecD-like DNA helicase [Clostridia bacterium]|nr:ATP-dependent RecD-like DNA helicase [Clostridia bacterium]